MRTTVAHGEKQRLATVARAQRADHLRGHASGKKSLIGHVGALHDGAVKTLGNDAGILRMFFIDDLHHLPFLL